MRRVWVSLETPPCAIARGENAIETESGASSTLRVALAPDVSKGRSEVRALDRFSSVPARCACTSRAIVQASPDATRPPVKASEVADAAGAKVPPQEVDPLGMAATVMPSGKSSVKASDLTAMALAALSIVKVSLEIPPGPTLAGEKALAKPGASTASTLSPAEIAVLVPSDEVTLCALFR